jgi:hypothetical protein
VNPVLRAIGGFDARLDLLPLYARDEKRPTWASGA